MSDLENVYRQALEDHMIGSAILTSGKLEPFYAEFRERFLSALRLTKGNVYFDWTEPELVERLHITPSDLRLVYSHFFFAVAEQVRAHQRFTFVVPGIDGLSRYPETHYTLTFYR